MRLVREIHKLQNDNKIRHEYRDLLDSRFHQWKIDLKTKTTIEEKIIEYEKKLTKKKSWKFWK
jgi:hypothetical protein